MLESYLLSVNFSHLFRIFLQTNIVRLYNLLQIGRHIHKIHIATLIIIIFSQKIIVFYILSLTNKKFIFYNILYQYILLCFNSYIVIKKITVE